MNIFAADIADNYERKIAQCERVDSMSDSQLLEYVSKMTKDSHKDDYALFRAVQILIARIK